MSSNHPDKEDRLERHYRRVHTHEPRCVVCGETDPRCLEKHHIAGRRYDPVTALVCRNCHRKLSDDQLDHAPRGQEQPVEGKLAAIALFLLGLCDFLLLIVERLREFGDWLIKKSSGTDPVA
jgi:hypothetical protein